MPKTQTKTQFFESIVTDKKVPAAQMVLFFTQAYDEQDGDPGEQLQLLNLLAEHRPELEKEAARSVIRGT